MRKLIIFSVVLFTCSSISAKYGIGYVFFDRLVSKKVYESPKRNKIRLSNIPIKIEKALNVLNAFEMRVSKRGIKELSSLAPYNKRVSHPLKTTKIKTVLRIRARYTHAWNNYVELRPKKKIIFPKWIKSLDFWMYGIEKKLDVYIYLSTKPNTIRRIKMGRLTYFHWQRLYANIFPVRYKNERQVHLVKIRIIGHRLNAVKDLITFMAGFNIYNFKRTRKNLYLDPVNVLFDINKKPEINWKFQIGDKPSNVTVLKREFDRERDKNVIKFLILTGQHKNDDCMFRFINKLIILRRYKISIWLYGKAGKEKLSLIFRDYKDRVFEIEFASLSFRGWRRMELTIPDKFFIPIGRGNYIRTRYIELWGLKISPNRNKEINFYMGDIKIFRDFRFERFKVPSR